MRSYKIPLKNRDLCKYALLKNTKRPVFFAIYIAFFAAAFMFFLNRRHEDAEALSFWVYPFFCAAVLISGWFICGMNGFVADRSFCGVIKSNAFMRNYGVDLTRNGKSSVDEHTYMKITVLDCNGKKRKIKVLLFDDGYDGYYREGGTLIKFRGLNYPLCLESEKDGIHLCGVCGVRTYYKNGKTINGEAEIEMADGCIICRSCHNTLINIDELTEGLKKQ